MSRAILPGATIGVLGSGQLGRMFAIAARRMGYRVHTYSPDSDTPIQASGPFPDSSVAERCSNSAGDLSRAPRSNRNRNVCGSAPPK